MLAAGPAAAQPSRVTLGPPVLAADGSVRWTAATLAPPSWTAGLELRPRSSAQGIALWTRVAERDSLLRPLALRTIAELRLALADTAGADSALGAGASRPSLWHWPLVQARAGLWRSRGRTASADSLLAATDRTGWTEAERAAWLAQRMRLREDFGDTAQAAAFARQVIRVYPSFGVARVATATLERLMKTRGDSLSFDDELAAAEADRFAGARAAAERRFARALRIAPPGQRSAIATRVAGFRRLLQRPAEASRAIAVALESAPDAGARADALLERARLQQATGALDSALVTFERAATEADSSRREALLLEWAREAERAGKWSLARHALERAARAGGSRAPDARFRIGILHFAEGQVDSAAARWEGDASEPAMFWSAVAGRALARAGRDTAARRVIETRAASALRTVAARPGYNFYRVAARETLGTRGWPGAGVMAVGPGPRAVEAARTLASLGSTAEAASLLSRWNAGDARLGAGAATAEDRIAAAAVAYAIGSVPLAIGIADRAARALEDSLDARVWSAQPWLYPAVFDSLARMRLPSGLEPAMVLAVIRQESRFDPRARSVSDALGLMQLKLSTARDVQRRLRERGRLTEEMLFEPARNVRYGSAYFEWLRIRFGGWPSVALSAYNAGPGTIPAWTAELVARGGEALFTEIASNATAQDYVRKILANRAAYREMRPRR